MSKQLQKISPCLWFDNQAEEAAKFYVSIFENSKVLTMTHYGDADSKRKGSVLTVEFELSGQRFLALNGGPNFKFTEAISLMVSCDTQEELDGMWEKLTDGGAEVECGWLKDKYGLSWQIVPTILFELMKDPKRWDRVMQAVMKMKKLDIAGLQNA